MLAFILFFLAIPFLMLSMKTHESTEQEFTVEMAAFAILYFGIIVWYLGFIFIKHS